MDKADLLWGPVFEEVATLEGFAKARLDTESATVVWPNGADLAPDTLYLRVLTGEWPEGVLDDALARRAVAEAR